MLIFKIYIFFKKRDEVIVSYLRRRPNALQSHSGQSSLGEFLQDGFLLAHAHQKMLAPQPINNNIDFTLARFLFLISKSLHT